MQERRTLHCLHAREFMHKSRSAHFGIHIQHFDFAFEFSILHWLRLSAAFSGRDPRSKRKVEKRKECRCCWVDLVSSGLPVTIHINTIFLQSHYFANSSHVFFTSETRDLDRSGAFRGAMWCPGVFPPFYFVDL